jgi:hypothetical protein
MDDGLAARVAALERIVAELQRGRGLRDSADAAVPAALARVFGAETFTAKEAIRRGGVDEQLHAVLEDADVRTARELGWLLRSMAGADVSGFCIVRVRASTAGHRWRVSVSSD